MTWICDVCVIGGGPAGAVAAWKLASLGHAVLIVERAAFPRPHVGEALSPGIWPQLDLLGLTGAVCAAGFRPTATATVLWSGSAAEAVGHADPPGLMVDRGRFDSLLLEHARQAGACVLQPALARAPRRTESGWDVPLHTPAGERKAAARFLVDAGGRSSRLGGRRQRSGPPTLALHGTWKPPRGWSGETRIEAGSDEWFWAAQRPDGTLSAMVFLDAGRYRSARTAGTSREALYRGLLARSVLLAELPARAKPAGTTGACDATCRYDPEPLSDCSLKVGESAFALDPLSSTGVQKALQTAWTGAITVHTILTRPEDAAAARHFYIESHRATVERHTAWAAGFYAEARQHAGSLFWRRRAAMAPPPRPAPAPEPSGPPLGARWRLSATAKLIATPCITGDLIATRRALVHPGLERPVAFLDGVEIAPLLEALPERSTFGELTALWSRHMPPSPPGQAAALASWLIHQGILVPA
jgi:flavin-dependent dehydrogenase